MKTECEFIVLRAFLRFLRLPARAKSSRPWVSPRENSISRTFTDFSKNVVRDFTFFRYKTQHHALFTETWKFGNPRMHVFWLGNFMFWTFWRKLEITISANLCFLVRKLNVLNISRKSEKVNFRKVMFSG